jgi:endonuclease G, mitochondrial
MADKSVFQSQLEDVEVLKNLKRSGVLHEAATAVVREMPEGMAAAARPGPGNLERAIENIRAGSINPMQPDLAEAIVMLHGYPSLLIANGDYAEPLDEVWRKRLNPNRAAIKGVIGCTARVELKNHPSGMSWLGTAWLVDDDVMVTNRHVAQEFAELRQDGPQIMKQVEVNVDFAEEFGSTRALEYFVSSIVYIEPPDSEVDVAILRLAKGAASELGLRPVALNTKLSATEFLGVVGYPAKSPIFYPGNAMDRIFGGQYNVKRLAPGKIMNADYSSAVFTHNATTLGGNSGSAIHDIATGCIIGLHFAGSAQTQNYAVKAEHVANRLSRKSIGWRPCGGVSGGDGEEAERRRRETFDDRDGYNTEFIGAGVLSVPLPILNALQEPKAAIVDGSMAIKYRHFSVVLNKERRLAFYGAVNIDGDDLRKPRRPKGFTIDPRLEEDLQTGEAMYRDNDIDRGHLVRRLDPVWGSKEDADQANRDSMFFPNIAPQHKDLNQKIWNDLEDHILTTVDEANVKITVFVGCLFSDNDPVQKPTGIRVPMEFWKVVASAARPGRGRRSENRLQAQAFIMSQRDLITPGDLEIVFGSGFETYQVTIEHLERLTGLDFHKLKDADTFAVPDPEREEMVRESAGAKPGLARSRHMKPLKSVDDIV